MGSLGVVSYVVLVVLLLYQAGLSDMLYIRGCVFYPMEYGVGFPSICGFWNDVFNNGW